MARYGLWLPSGAKQTTNPLFASSGSAYASISTFASGGSVPWRWSSTSRDLKANGLTTGHSAHTQSTSPLIPRVEPPDEDAPLVVGEAGQDLRPEALAVVLPGRHFLEVAPVQLVGRDRRVHERPEERDGVLRPSDVLEEIA